ncbi:FAD-binding and (Fe-S)-binding domain-containing protein [Rarobacter faecitabidus]|uniref:FAD/FMN-containing dehydrogenase n=2 Tax=Bacteria TaxID=2 RepID=A0A542ZTY3_RARFA|nr:FAD-binding and (Fe-S)-binding domain-containing protein [Rarobacter faecitabidus]TQL63660.1 FAD/FMN-containing dehydrogenase [Rarobacter faecitabidus]
MTVAIEAPKNADIDGIVAALQSAVTGEVSTSNLRRAEYATDASNYRVPPQIVVIPRTQDDVLAALRIAREAGMAITTRGGGTSIAGNSIGPGMVIDFSRHLNRILEIDPESRTALIEPGVVMSDLQAAAAPHGLRFGPDPSTQNRATLGGMIGNNACGPHAVAYGRTSDNVVSLDVIDGLGRRYTAGRDKQGYEEVPGLEEFISANLALIRTEFGQFGRQVSGYSLEHLLPENGSDLARALTGTEGTVATILQARVRLVPIPSAPTLVVLGYETMPLAADDVPLLLARKPLAIEGMDARLIDIIKRAKGPDSVPDLPAGNGWLMVEVGGATADEAMDAARAIAAAANADDAMILPAGPEASRMWRIRADGAGLAGRTPSGDQGWPGWEDAAVRPENLGKYLRDFDSLLERYGLDGVPYGHFGDGCIHVRINLPLEDNADIFRRFLTDAAVLVAQYGGSLSGEHGDGRARSELLPKMYSDEAIRLFEQFKALFDPRDVMNPGVIVRPDPLDAHLRRPHAKPVKPTTGFAFRHDQGDFTKAVHRCTGVGKCRADNSAAGGFMCPSYQATKDEKDVTRGRARVLQEMINGSVITGGWSAPEVTEALDLCLSCKACSSDCPAGVDMAAYKAEALHRKYERKIRPINHYILGWLPRWARLVSSMGPVAAVANAALGIRPIGKLVLSAGGMDSRRKMAKFATQPFRRWVRSQDEIPVARDAGGSPRSSAAGQRTRVVLWADSFSDSMTPHVAQAALRVLDAAGYDVIVPGGEACCGLTWISTGQLNGARKKQAQLLQVLGPFAVAGIPIIGVEPSCTAVLRSDLLELHPDDPRAVAVAAQTMTLAELLTSEAPLGPGEQWQMPDLSDVTAVVQPHCHHHSVMGFGPDEKLLRDAGAELTMLAGCCGLAGNFGMEKGHYEVSVQVAQNELLPALRAAGEGDVYLADGFSCRTQASGLAGVEGKTLAELIADRL